MINIKSKIKILISVVLAASLVLGYFSFFKETKTVTAAWWDEKWHYRKAITINHNQVTADLTNFPMLVSLTDSNLGAHSQEYGDDIIFVDREGNKLKHEIESYASTTGTLVAWVKMPTLNSTQDEDIYMYYGNFGVGDQSDAENVWDENYIMVQHMASTSNTTRYDSTSNNHDGTMTGYEGDEATSTAKINGADDFDTTPDDYISIPDHDQLGGMSALTISTWIKFDQMPTTEGQNAKIVEKRHDDNPWYSYLLNVRESAGCGGTCKNQAYFVIRNDTGIEKNNYGTTELATSTWYYIVGTYDGTNLRVYLNGAIDDGGATVSSSTIYNSNYILALNFGSDIDGTIDEVRMSKSARSADWIQTEYNNQNDPATFLTSEDEEVGPGPVGYWTFDRGYGTTAYDESGQGNNGTISGATWQDESMCISGSCLYFDGTDDKITINGYDDSDSGSVGMWFKLSSLPTDGSSTALWSVGHWMNAEWYMYLQCEASSTAFSGTRLTLGSSRGSPTAYTKYGETELSANTWYYVSYTHDSSEPKLYLNAKEESLTNITSNSEGVWWDDVQSTSQNRRNRIGNMEAFWGQKNFFHGYIDEVKIYPYARDLDQIRADYNAGLAGVKSNKGISASFGGDSTGRSLTDGLVGYWNLDESATTSGAFDSSGNGMTGSFTGHASTTVGKYGNGGLFSWGATGSISVGTLDLEPNKGSLSVWFNRNNTYDGEGWTTIFSAREDFTDDDIAITIYDFNQWYNIRLSLGGTHALDLKPYEAQIYRDSEWHHLTLTWLGGKYWFYYNGELVDNDVYDDSSFDTVQAAYIGAWKGNSGLTDNFNGKIDEVRVYNRVLSKSEVKKLYEWAPGPVAHWKFDEKTGQTIYDSAASTTFSGGNQGTLGSSVSADSVDPTWTRGKYGSALVYDGEDDYVDCGLNTKLDNIFNGGGTVAVWIYPTGPGYDASDYPSIVHKASGASGQNGWEVQWNSNNNFFFFERGHSVNQGAWKTPNDSISLNIWQHVAVVYNDYATTSLPTLYINGIPQTISALWVPDGKASSDVGQTITIGNYASSRSFEGIIDDIRIYNYARTQKQILEDMGGSSPSAGSGQAIDQKVLYLKFDEGRGNTAYDSSIHNNNFTLSYTAWTKQGKIDQAWNGTGTNWLSRADDSDFDATSTDDFSITLWFKSDSASNPGSAEFLIDKESSSAGYAIYLETDGDVVFGIDDDATWGPDDSAGNKGQDYYDGAWHHVAAIKNNTNNIKLYLDGELLDSDTSLVADNSLANSAAFYIGDRDGSNDGSEFNGDIDEVKIYRFALNEDEVRLDYNQGRTAVLGSASTASSTESAWAANRAYCVPGDSAQCSPPVLELKMDEKTGVTAYDTSGNGNDGTLTWMSTSTNGGWTRGKYGSALDFDGTDDYVDIDGALTTLANDTAGTISFWANLDADDGADHTILGVSRDNADAVNTELLVEFRMNTDSVRVRLMQGNAWQFNLRTADNTLDPYIGKWVFVTVAQNGTYPKIYLNGVNQTLTAVDETDTTMWFYDIITDAGASPADTANIGVYEFEVDEYNNFNGKIDHVQIFNYERSAAQVAWDFNKGKPIAHWKFDECQGGTIYDHSGKSNHGTLQLGTSGVTATGTCASSSASFWWNGRNGKKKSAGSFDGDGDYVNINGSGGISSQDIDALTISAWYKSSDSIPGVGGASWAESIYWGMANNGSGWPQISFRIRADLEGRAELRIKEDFSEGDPGDVTSVSNVVDEQWHHIVAVRTGGGASSRLKMYIDGILESDVSDSNGGGTLDYENSQVQFWIGAHAGWGDMYLDGSIDEVKIYNYALTAEQVKSDYNMGVVHFK